jgi:hypothetical protein
LQFATSSLQGTGHGGRHYAPFAFLELRNLVAGNKELASKLKRLERKVDSHDQAITGLIDSMRQPLAPPDPKKRPIGFVIPVEKRRRNSAATRNAARNCNARVTGC